MEYCLVDQKENCWVEQKEIRRAELLDELKVEQKESLRERKMADYLVYSLVGQLERKTAMMKVAM